MVKKYYAVKKGRHPGIYKTWAECQKEVNGYPNAKFKSFLTLKGANEWLQATGNTVPSTKAVDYSDNILVYTDGGSRNHGNKLGQHVKANDKAAWAYFILTKLLELGLQDQPITAILDSHYVLDPIMKGWLTNWQRRGWLTASGKPVANQKLWEEVLTLLPQFPNLHFDWTKGHATNAGNNRVDELLNKTMDQL